MPDGSRYSLDKSKIQILLLEGIHISAEETLRAAGYSSVEIIEGTVDATDLHTRLRGVHLLGIRSRTQLSAEVLAATDRLMAVGCFSVGTNQVDLDAAAARGIPVFNAPHSNTRSVAELVIGLSIMLFRDIARRSRLAHKGEWLKTARQSNEARGKTIGVIGYGHIGSQVSVLAEAMGMRVIYHDIAAKLPLGNALPASSLRDLLGRSDVVTLHVPQTADTNSMMGREELQSMKHGSFLINASRGTVVNIDALAELLRTGHIGGAAVDVFPTEPKSPSEAFSTPLQGIPNVVLTPHIGGSTQEAQQNIGIEVAKKLALYSDRGTSLGSVNFPELNLAEQAGTHRILHVHRNVPGILRAINRVFAEAEVNILGQHLQTKGDLGYVVLDIETQNAKNLLGGLTAIEGTLRARILY